SNGAVAPSDYVAQNGTVTFAPGQVLQNITVPVKGDTMDEVDEIFSVVLSTPTNAAIADDTGVGTIQNTDQPPTIEINDPSKLENQPAITFTVKLSAPSGKQITVDYQTADVASGPKATADVDYVAVPRTTLTFLPGQTFQVISVALKDDTQDEPDE